ncbi:hypothetical protein H920_20194 [Fukomys damarensis]|uniref:Uncharacterized protein n=1 Tax=Fukomys damarensis TaxID=885580 RepID=A0A091D6E3_FUKDA|nr:hypothetical protein H920_20194 [Fukomys damarensis]
MKAAVFLTIASILDTREEHNPAVAASSDKDTNLLPGSTGQSSAPQKPEGNESPALLQDGVDARRMREDFRSFQAAPLRLYGQ